MSKGAGERARDGVSRNEAKVSFLGHGVFRVASEAAFPKGSASHVHAKELPVSFPLTGCPLRLLLSCTPGELDSQN